MKLNWKDIVKTIAPTIGSALPLPPPLGQLAMGQIIKALGIDDKSSPKAVETAIANATPDQMATLKELDNTFKLEMEKLGVDVLELEAQDRNSARDREIKTGDKTPAILGMTLVSGFFVLLGFLAFYTIPPDNKEVVYLIVGALTASFTQVMNYFFGSSASSAKKTKLLSGNK
jgi:hypothetical protein